jgi:hypothetical protein
LLTVPQNGLTGSSLCVTVKALDASNRVATGYTGTVHFTCTTDTTAVLPADYTFTRYDFGQHNFKVTFNTAGSQTLTATDTVTGSITGIATTTVNPAPVASQFLVLAPAYATAGVSACVTVIVLDQYGHQVPNYRGTVAFTSSDASAALPANYTFTSCDRGQHKFKVTYNTTGSQTLTATDTVTSITGTSAATTVNPAPLAAQLLVKTSGQAVTGVATWVMVTALNASGRTMPNYTATIHFTSSDSAATLPADYTFTTSDRGCHKFQVTFNTAGPQTVTVTDTNSITGEVALTVYEPGVVTRFGLQSLGIALAAFPAPVRIVALDALNNVVTGYTGTVHFSSSDSSAILPADYTFTADDAGSHVFSVTFNATGNQTLTATDGSLSGITKVNVLSQLKKRGSPIAFIGIHR